MNIAIIPARGGSKRIPRKNIRLFRGKPMIAWSIEAALDSQLFASVHVSTEDREIADIATSLGAEVPFFRDRSLADDHAGLDAVVFDHVAKLHAGGVVPEACCCIFATAPFLTSQLLCEGFARLSEADKYKFAVAVSPFAFPIQRAVRVDGNGAIRPFQPDKMSVRSQDLEPAYHEAGQFYWARTAALLQRVSIYAPNVSIPVVIPSFRVQDIDREEDWVRAECMHRALEEMSCKS